jgi:iron complex transport system substrate-binding protein
MLLMLGTRGQIASVSAQATGPLSAYAAQARDLPVNRGAAEQIIASRASILLVSDAVDQRSAAALARFGVKVIPLPDASTWPQIEAMTHAIARAIGRPARGQAVIAQMRARLTKARPTNPHSTWPSVIYYRPDGGGAGTGSFVDLALSSAGFRNLQAEWGPPLWGGVPAERVVRTPPDLFAVSYFDTSRNAASILRRNPVLWGKARTRPVMPIHGKYWNCGSPLLVDAVEQLAAHRGAFLKRTRR